MSIKNRHRIRKATAKTRRVQRPWPALVGDGAGTIEVPGQPNLWYVRPVGTDIPMPVYRGSAPAQEGYPIYVGQDVYNRRWLRILGTNIEALAGGGLPGSSVIQTVDPHAASHLITGTDPVWIDARQVVNVLAYATTGMTVHVNSGWVIVDNQPVPVSAADVDMTASIPGSGASYSLIVADTDGALSVIDGTAASTLLDLGPDDVPVIPGGYAAIGLVRLWDGQTELSRSSTSPDVTPLYLAQIATGGASYSKVVIKTNNYTATASDNVIIANKGTAITITLPEATGSGLTLVIKSIGAGTCTIEGDDTDTIDGELNQALDQWESAQIVDYVAGAWVII